MIIHERFKFPTGLSPASASRASVLVPQTYDVGYALETFNRSQAGHSCPSANKDAPDEDRPLNHRADTVWLAETSILCCSQWFLLAFALQEAIEYVLLNSLYLPTVRSAAHVSF